MNVEGNGDDANPETFEGEISDYQSFKLLGLQDFRLSGFQGLRFSGFETF